MNWKFFAAVVAVLALVTWLVWSDRTKDRPGVEVGLDGTGTSESTARVELGRAEQEEADARTPLLPRAERPGHTVGEAESHGFEVTALRPIDFRTGKPLSRQELERLCFRVRPIPSGTESLVPFDRQRGGHFFAFEAPVRIGVLGSRVAVLGPVSVYPPFDREILVPVARTGRIEVFVDAGGQEGDALECAIARARGGEYVDWSDAVDRGATQKGSVGQTRWLFEGVFPGRYWISVRSAGGDSRFQAAYAEVTSGGATSVLLESERAPRAELVVEVSGNREPLNGCRIWVDARTLLDIDWVEVGRTDIQGRCRFDVPRAGQYLVRADLPGGSKLKSVRVDSDGGVCEFQIDTASLEVKLERAVPGRSIFLYRERNLEGTPRAAAYESRECEEADSLRFTGLPPGYYTVGLIESRGAGLDRLVSSDRALLEAPKISRAYLADSTAEGVLVRAVDARGNPMPAANIYVAPEASRPALWRASGRTSQSDAVDVPLPAPGKGWVEVIGAGVEHGGPKFSSGPVLVNAAEFAEGEVLELICRPTGRVLVRSATGRGAGALPFVCQLTERDSGVVVVGTRYQRNFAWEQLVKGVVGGNYIVDIVDMEGRHQSTTVTALPGRTVVVEF